MNTIPYVLFCIGIILVGWTLWRESRHGTKWGERRIERMRIAQQERLKEQEWLDWISGYDGE